jgi:chromosome segregation ATPase
MNQAAHGPSHQPIRSGVRRATLAIASSTFAIGVLGGCSNVSPLAKEHVARSEVAVQQTQQNIGHSESGATELQAARTDLAAAQSALAKGDNKAAERNAAHAQLHAELAAARSQSAAARRAADEVLASSETLRQEAERTSPTSR